jgi:hypothetical protein
MVTPKIDEALSQALVIPTAYRAAPIDALADLEGLILSKALPHAAASPNGWRTRAAREFSRGDPH